MAQRLSSFETSLGVPRASLTLEPRISLSFSFPIIKMMVGVDASVL